MWVVSRLLFGIYFADYLKNHQLLSDELYLGLRRPRVRGKEYDEFVDIFVQSARKLYPKAYIHLYDSSLIVRNKNLIG